MPDFSKREKILFGFLLILVILCCITTYYAFFKSKPDIAFKLEEDDTIPVSSSADEDKTSEIMVYVMGAIRNPGVYSLDDGARVKDVIDLAGGCLEEADLFKINLAQKLQDEDALYVPKIGEFPETDQPSETFQSGIINGFTSGNSNKININKANLQELDTLPGIGPATAQKIIDYRSQNGPFTSIEEIKNVSGIGEKKFEQIKEQISVR
ncbi:MAG TPA: competence protein ComEA [Thermoanaerobacterales bacterium]|jgi:competence protein ComEA|nr:competence protein ComEA [Thermoanaerobacterales bacterium]